MFFWIVEPVNDDIWIKIIRIFMKNVIYLFNKNFICPRASDNLQQPFTFEMYTSTLIIFFSKKGLTAFCERLNLHINW